MKIVVYNLSSYGKNDLYSVDDSDITTNPTTSELEILSKTDVEDIVTEMFNNYADQIRWGSSLSSEVFLVDSKGIRLGSTDFDVAPFSVTMAGALKATSATITGSVTATSGAIGGWVIGATTLYSPSSNPTITLDSANELIKVGNGTPYLIIDGANATIKTSDFATGSLGWNIDTDEAEFNNVRVRGMLKTTVFQKDVVSAVGGQLLVSNADILDAKMTALDASTLTISGETTFAVNDMLHIKDETDEEYLRITNVASAPTYSVTRDLAGAYSANNNPTWEKGTAVVKEGESDGASAFSGGFLKMLGEGTNSPKYSVFKRTGVAYNAITEYVTMGNLNGQLDYVSDEYGFLAGTTADGYFAFDPTNGARVQGKLLVRYSPFTAGWDLTTGEFVALESDNELYPTRITGIDDTAEDTQDSAIFASGARNAYQSMAFITRDIILHFSKQVGSSSIYQRLTLDVDNDAIMAVTHNGNPTSTGASNPSLPMLKRMSDTTAILVESDIAGSAGTEKVYAQLFSGLDVAVTTNAVCTVSTDANTIVVERYTDTQAVACYRDYTGGDVVFVKLDISGTTITAGSEEVVYAGTIAKVFDLVRFGDTDYFLCLFDDGTNFRVAVFQWDGTTFTAGGSATVAARARGNPVLCALDDTRVGLAFQNSTNLQALVVSRSGTTPTVNSATIIDTVTNADQDNTRICRIGPDSFFVMYADTTVVAGNTDQDAILVRAKGNVTSVIGSKINVQTTQQQGGTCTRVSAKHVLMEVQTNATTGRFRLYGMNNNYDDMIGVVAEDIAENATGGVFFGPYANGLTGVELNGQYYIGPDGEFITYAEGGLVRKAIGLSSTEIELASI